MAGTETGKNDQDHPKNKQLNKWVSYAQILTPFVLLGAAIFAGIAAFAAQSQLQVAQSEYRVRTRPYLAVERIVFIDEGGDSVSLVINVTNFGQTPATDIGMGKLSISTESTEPWSDIAIINVEDTRNTVVFPQRLYSSRITVTRSDYEVVVKAKKLKLRLDYSCGTERYWYEADARLQPNGLWTIESEREN